MTHITFQHQLTKNDISGVLCGQTKIDVDYKLDEVEQKRVVAEQENQTLTDEMKDRGLVVMTLEEAQDIQDDIEAGENLVQMMQEAASLWETNPEQAAQKMTHVMFIATGKKLQFAGAIAA
jgi:hypothetical protein